MKQGSSHVDWAISIGIFLLSIVAILAFLKPGIKEANRDDILLNQIQDSFESKVFWTVKKVPLFVTQLDVPGTNNRKVEVNINNWKFSSQLEYSAFYDTKFDIRFENPRKFVLECKIGTCDTNSHGPFVLIYYNTHNGAPDFDEDLCPVDDKCDAELGITEDVKGVDEDAVADLQSEGYEVLKQVWTFPEKKEFAVYQNDLKPENKLFGSETYEQANVFSRRVKYWELDKDGGRTAITIIFLVW
jgi:hypothetical protein